MATKTKTSGNAIERAVQRAEKSAAQRHRDYLALAHRLHAGDDETDGVVDEILRGAGKTPADLKRIVGLLEDRDAIRAKESQLAERREAADVLRLKIERAAAEYDEVRRHHETVIRRLQGEFDYLNSDKIQLRAEIDGMKFPGQFSELNDPESASIREEIKTAEKARADYDLKISAMQTRLARVEANPEAIPQAAMQCRTTIVSFKSEAESLDSKLTALRERLEEVESLAVA